VLAHPFDQLHEPARSPAHVHKTRELRLPAGPTLVNEKLLRGVARNLGAEIVLHQSEREIDAGRDAGRRPDLAVADEDAIGIERHVRIPTPSMVRAVPVRRSAAAVEPSGFRQKKGSRADAGDAARLRSLEPRDDLLCCSHRADDLAAGHDEYPVGQKPSTDPDVFAIYHRKGFGQLNCPA